MKNTTKHILNCTFTAVMFAIALTFMSGAFTTRVSFGADTKTIDSAVVDDSVTESLKTPSKPDINIVSMKSRVYIKWKACKNANSYEVWRKSKGKSWEKIDVTSKKKYTDKDVTKGCEYKYRIRAVNKGSKDSVKSAYSSTKSVSVSAIDPDKKMVALTFDDGPGPYTQAIVNCLKKYGMHATFFVVGSNILHYSKALKAEAASGCEIANHTWGHVYLPKQSTGGMLKQVVNTNKKIKAITGVTPKLLRPPYGATSAGVKSAIKMPQIMWSIDTLDWKTRNTAKTVASVMNNVKDGSIVLMHDIHKPTMKAALQIIPKLVSKGYQLVTVSELAEYKGVELKNGKTYSSIH